MMKNILLALFLFFPISVYANQVLFGGMPANNLSTSVSNYFPLMGSSSLAETTEPEISEVIPTAGNLSQFRVYLNSAPGAGKYYNTTVYLNGVASNLTVSITGTDTTGIDTTHILPVAIGNNVSVGVTPAGTPGGAKMSFATLFQPTITDENIFMGATGSNDYVKKAGLPQFYGLFGMGFVPQSDGSWTDIVMPGNGTLKKFIISLSAAPGTNQWRNFTICNNDTATNLFLNVTGANTIINDSVSTASVVEGNRLSMIAVDANGTSANAFGKWSLVWLPNTTGNFMTGIRGLGNNGDVVPGAISYRTMCIGTAIRQPAETNTSTVSTQNYTIKNIYVAVRDGTPNVGEYWNFTLRNNSTDTNLTLSMTGTSNISSAIGNVTITEGSLLDTSINGTAGSSSSAPFVSYLCNFPTSGEVSSRTSSSSITGKVSLTGKAILQ